MAHSQPSPVSEGHRGPKLGDADYTVVWVRGEHDIATKVSLVDALSRAAQLEDGPLLVDLSAVTFMDASIIGALVASRNRLQSRGQTLEVRRPSPQALRVLELCRLAHLVHREPLPTTGVEVALSTWVEVPPIPPSGRADGVALSTWVEVPPIPPGGRADQVARVPARLKARQPARALATAQVHIGEDSTTVEADRVGP